jgi:hypothetical protein
MDFTIYKYSPFYPNYEQSNDHPYNKMTLSRNRFR